MKKLNKKGVGGLDFLRTFMISLAVIVVLAFALVIMGANLKSTVPATTADNNLTIGIITNFSTAIGSIGNQIGTWVTLASLVVIIGIIAVVIYLVMGFGGSREGSYA